MIIFLSNVGTVRTDTTLSKLYLASLLCYHHKSQHVLNFIELRKEMNLNSKNESPHRTEHCQMK